MGIPKEYFQRSLHTMKLIKRILNWLMFILTGKGPIADEAIEEGLIDYSGQGRDKYGK